jgi:hypothetical protein
LAGFEVIIVGRFSSDHRGKENCYLYKTIFIMPRAIEEPTSDFDVASHWITTANAMAELGMSLPRYLKGGALFTMSDSGEVTQLTPFGIMDDIHTPKQLAENIRLLFAPDDET